MNEVKRPKKPLIFYYTLVMVALVLFNFLLVPWIAEQQIIEVDYGTFITMTENKEIDQVKVEDNQILFEGKDGKIYKTGLMNDPDLVNRLHDSGAKFGGEIVEETSPLLNILLTWVLPVVLFIALGQFMSKKLMDRAGSPPTALNFPTCRAWTRRRKACRRLWITSTIRTSTGRSAPPCPRAFCW